MKYGLGFFITHPEAVVQLFLQQVDSFQFSKKNKITLQATPLGVSADQLLGIEKLKKNGRPRDTKLWRRFSQVEKLSPAQRKPIVQLMDAFLEREKLNKAS